MHSGRVHIQVPPISAAATGIRHQGKGDRNNASTPLNAKAASAAFFPRRLIAPLSRQRRICGPKRSEEHTSELQSLMRISYAVFCLKKKTQSTQHIYS